MAKHCETCGKDISYRHHTARFCVRCANIRNRVSTLKSQQKNQTKKYNELDELRTQLKNSEKQREYLSKQLEKTMKENEKLKLMNEMYKQA